jgi:hypothetical protein
MGEAVVVEMRVGEDDRRETGRARVVREHAGDIAQDPFCHQVRRWPLRGVPREVTTVRCSERHTQIEQDAGAVVGRDLDAHAAYLMLSPVNRVAQGDSSLPSRCPDELDTMAV